MPPAIRNKLENLDSLLGPAWCGVRENGVAVAVTFRLDLRGEGRGIRVRYLPGIGGKGEKEVNLWFRKADL